MENRVEKIVCPKCDKIQFSEVETTPFWDIYIHDCEECGYTIMESEWDRVKCKNNENNSHLFWR